MKNQVFFFSLFSFLFLLPFPLIAGIDFDDQSATVNVGVSAELNIGANGQTITGTLVQPTGAAITGTPLVFSNGILNRNGNTATLTGIYDAAAGQTIKLDGDKTLQADEGFAPSTIEVTGTGNSIKGLPTLSSELVLPTGVSLSIGLTGPLNQSIQLDTGNLVLIRDLHCRNNVEIKGAGSVLPSGHSVHLGKHYANPITSTLSWQDAQSIEMNGRLTLDGEWTFNGVCKVEGNGQTLELGSGGKLIIGAGDTLELHNLTLYSVNNNNIVFTDADSKLVLDGCTLFPLETMTTSVGKIEVVGDTAFVLKEYDWFFSDTAVLTVDRCTLSLNTLANSPLPSIGTINAPKPVYVDHAKKGANITDNIAGGNLVVSNAGVITEIGERIVEEAFDGGGTSGTLSLSNSTLMGPDDLISVVEDTTINGKGSRILFARPGKPQVSVAAGKTLTLNDVEFHNVTNTTIGMGVGSKIIIGKNVIFTLSDDLVWDAETIEITDGEVFQLRGSGRARKITFVSPVRGTEAHSMSYDTHLQLNTGTLQLQNVALNGIRHVAYTSKFVDGKTVTGAIVLAGNARIDVDRSFMNLHLVVQGQNNQIKVVRNEVTIGGSLTFDDFSMSDLQFSFVFPPTFTGVPRIHFENNYVNVASAEGQASLVFDSSNVRVRNKGIASVVMGNNSVLRGNRVQIESYPIVQSSSRFTIYPGTQLNSVLESGALVFETGLLEAMRGPQFRTMTNAWALQRDMQWMKWSDECETRRSISLPNENLKPVLKYASSFSLPPLGGNIYLRDEQGSSYSNMRFLATQPLNLTLELGVSVLQAAVPATLKTGDIINVIGGTMQKPNRLSLTADTRIEGKVLWDDNAVLMLDFDAALAPPTVTIDKDALLDLGTNGVLLVSGCGALVFEDGCVVNFGTGNGSIIMNNEAQLLLSSGQTLTLRGDGTLECANAARLVVENGSTLICGTKFTDDTALRISTSASIRVGQDLGAVGSSARSYLSFAGSAGTLDCSHVGSVVVSKNGVLEFNALRGAAHRGRMKKIDVSMGGTLYVADGGQLTLAENIGGVAGITWNMLGGSIGGVGLVALHDTELVGKIQERIFAETDASSKVLVSRLVQTVPNLDTSSVFYDAANIRKLYTKNGVVVTLGEDEVITSDSSNGTVLGTDSVTGENFLYTAAGARL